MANIRRPQLVVNYCINDTYDDEKKFLDEIINIEDLENVWSNNIVLIYLILLLISLITILNRTFT